MALIADITDENGNTFTGGSVNMTIGNTRYDNLPVIDGQVIKTIDNLPAKMYTIYTEFNEDDAYTPSNNISYLTVERIKTSATVQVLDNTLGNVTLKVKEKNTRKIKENKYDRFYRKRRRRNIAKRI